MYKEPPYNLCCCKPTVDLAAGANVIDIVYIDFHLIMGQKCFLKIYKLRGKFHEEERLHSHRRDPGSIVAKDKSFFRFIHEFFSQKGSILDECKFVGKKKTTPSTEEKLPLTSSD